MPHIYRESLDRICLLVDGVRRPVYGSGAVPKSGVVDAAGAFECLGEQLRAKPLYTRVTIAIISLYTIPMICVLTVMVCCRDLKGYFA